MTVILELSVVKKNTNHLEMKIRSIREYCLLGYWNEIEAISPVVTKTQNQTHKSHPYVCMHVCVNVRILDHETF